jgi:hypothetical protein
MRHLDLGHTQVSGTLSPALCNWALASIVSLAGSRVSGSLPECLNQWTSLYTLDLGFCAFNRTGTGVFTMPVATTVQLNNNNLAFVHDDCPGVRSTIRSLDLSGNPLNSALQSVIECYMGSSGGDASQQSLITELALDDTGLWGPLVGTLHLPRISTLTSISLRVRGDRRVLAAALVTAAPLRTTF